MGKYTEGEWEIEVYYGKSIGGVYIYDEKEEICVPVVENVSVDFLPLISQAPAMHKELKKAIKGLIDYPEIQKILDRVEGEV